jgi:hypothetical protein
MKYIKPLSLVTTFCITSTFCTVASADCIYFADIFTPSNNLLSDSSGEHRYLNRTIPVIEGYDPDMAMHIGDMMNFQCLSNVQTPSFAPDNYTDQPLVSRLSDNLLVQFAFTNSDNPMQAIVSCDDITIKFNPESYDYSNHDSQRFMGEVISLMAITQRNIDAGQPFNGTYAIIGPSYAETSFVENKSEPCLRLVPSS